MTLSRKPLKGMRQLEPEDKRIENWILDVIAETGRAYGFEEYEAPVLEPLELFTAKSGSELAVEQSYNFTDKGGRELIMRPELTPSLARMVAASGELIYPVRWMSFPVCYRYERPQRGRNREFMQFNLDILGVNGLEAELDVVLVLSRILRDLGAGPDQFAIRYSSRKLASFVLKELGLEEQEIQAAYSVMDKRDKMPEDKWMEWARDQLENSESAERVIRFASCESVSDPWLADIADGSTAYDEIRAFGAMLAEAGVSEARFEASVVRGLDYYTGIVFEVMDTGGENRRAICGGGRYDDLVGLFGGQQISGVGFGLGLLTLKLFLETYSLIPDSVRTGHPAQLFLAVYSGEERGYALKLSEELRDKGLRVEMDVTGKGLSRQFKIADRKGIPLIAVIGPEEVESGVVQLKSMASGEENRVEVTELADTVMKAEG
ncbi:MAG: histidine--tRNA ligase [Candidatus Aegiribacteria sp.]|nr:histidine--tRNA ligase [Candidatus Aegiribacteria sp.]MBD3294323.1 histidine--tRNA ligase [Candidatus Fermentibacteria bacterium]